MNVRRNVKKNRQLHTMKQNTSIFALMVTIFLTCVFSSCQTNIYINDHFDKTKSIKLSVGNPLKHIDLTTNSEKYKKLVEWSNKNTGGWHPTFASYISEISLHQGDFRLLYLKEGGVVIGFTDPKGEPKQFSKTIDKGELDFLLVND